MGLRWERVDYDDDSNIREEYVACHDGWNLGLYHHTGDGLPFWSFRAQKEGQHYYGNGFHDKKEATTALKKLIEAMDCWSRTG